MLGGRAYLHRRAPPTGCAKLWHGTREGNEPRSTATVPSAAPTTRRRTDGRGDDRRREPGSAPAGAAAGAAGAAGADGRVGEHAGAALRGGRAHPPAHGRLLRGALGLAGGGD